MLKQNAKEFQLGELSLDKIEERVKKTTQKIRHGRQNFNVNLREANCRKNSS